MTSVLALPASSAQQAPKPLPLIVMQATFVKKQPSSNMTRPALSVRSHQQEHPQLVVALLALMASSASKVAPLP